VDRSTVIEEFRAYLRDHNLPVTAQRQAVAEVVLAGERHLSAEEIEQELATRGIPVGTATVYRTLDVLLKSGLVVERDFGEGFKRYEPARGIPQHEHLLCTVCGRVTEFRDERLERQRHRLVIYGLCGECSRGDAPR
jgi:Fur family ferric uptake transcriptional regulator